MIITIDGPSGSLKTTMANKLKNMGVRVLRADDFFYPFGEKKHRLSGNFNAPFFIKNIMPKILTGESFDYFAFDCKTQKYYKKHAPASDVTVIEGSYSSTKLLNRYRDLSIFIKANQNACIKRIKRRVGAERFKMFEARWIPDERRYFIKNRNYKNAVIIKNYSELEAIIKNLKIK